MNIIHKILLGAACAAAAAFSLAAQSPYSMKGYGLLGDRASSAQRTMGGVGYAMRDSRQINVMNPASYSAIDTMTFLFDIGADVGMYRSKEGSSHGKLTLGGLDYITMQVPIGRRMGASIGLLPFSDVDYSFGQKIVNGHAAYQGSGGISEAYIGFSGRPAKGLSLGFNAGYLFGNILHDNYAIEGTTGAQSLYEMVMKVQSFNMQFGLQYSVDLNRTNSLTLGLTYTLGHNLHGTAYGTRYDISNKENEPKRIGERHLQGFNSLPHTFGAGLAYSRDRKLTVEADFTYQPWSKAKFGAIEDFSDAETFNDRYRGAVGFQYQARQRGAWLRKVAYRIGGYYEQDYQHLDVRAGDKVRQYGITCGFGLPTPLRTRVNVGFEWRHRYSTPTTTVTENYYLFTLGINLSENWFVPSKIR